MLALRAAGTKKLGAWLWLGGRAGTGGVADGILLGGWKVGALG